MFDIISKFTQKKEETVCICEAMTTWHMKSEQSRDYSELLEFESSYEKIRKMQRPDVNIFLRKRYFVSFMTCLGTMCMYILQTNMSMAIMEITSNKNTSINDSLVEKAELDWNSKTKGFVLGAFYLGYLMGPVGGLFSMKYGGATIFGIGIAATAILTTLTPFLLELNFLVYIMARVAAGIFESFSMSCIPDIFVRWAPVNERSRLLICGMMGYHFGEAFNLSFSGLLAEQYGWKSILLVTGGLSLVWFAIWFLTVFDDPLEDYLITRKERNYFRNCSPPRAEKNNFDFPWNTLFTSKPFWAYVNEFFSFGWSYSLALYCLPLFVKDVYHVDVKNVGLISGIPIITASIGMIQAACIADYIESEKICSRLTLHRVFIAAGQFAVIFMTMYTGLYGSFEESIVCNALSRFFLGFAEMSYQVMAIDVFFEYAGIVKGFSVAAIGVSQFLNPAGGLLGYMIADHERSSWNLYFLFLNALNVWGVIVFLLYGSGEMQDWAKPKTDLQDDEISNKTLTESCNTL